MVEQTLPEVWPNGVAELDPSFDGQWNFVEQGPPIPCPCGSRDFSPVEDYDGVIWACDVCGTWAQEVGT